MKDPNFPLYTQDFIVGTMMLTNEEVGIYIRLLCIQHQHGGIIDSETFKHYTNGNRKIASKFLKTEDGFYNERLMNEMVKRQHKSTSLSENAKKGWALRKQSISIPEAEPMPKVLRKARPTLEQVENYCKERNSSVNPKVFFDNYESSGWIKSNGQKVIDWKATIRTWENKEKTKPQSIMQPKYVAPKPISEEERVKAEDNRKAFAALAKGVL